MAICTIDNGIDPCVNNKGRIGGAKERFWLANFSQFDSLTIDGDGYVTDMAFKSDPSETFGLYKFNGYHLTNFGAETATPNNGVGFFLQNPTLVIPSRTPAEDKVIEDLLNTKTILILESNEQEFFIYGYPTGLFFNQFDASMGQTFGDIQNATFTLEGASTERPKRWFDTDYATTLAAIEALEV